MHEGTEISQLSEGTMEASGRRLLILSCSQRKRLDEGLLPAVDRYDGPAFRVLRRFLSQTPFKAPETLILSAEHGLIPQSLPIPVYDRKMTPARARELRPQVLAELDRIADAHSFQETLIFAGQQYLTALSGANALLVPGLNARACAGPLGRKLSRLHDWLYGSPPKLRYNSTMPAEGSVPRIRGVEVSLTSEQILEAVRGALAEGWGNPKRYESWYVTIDGQRVAPKWLVSQLSGLPVGAFTTDEARRLLARLGVEVRRT